MPVKNNSHWAKFILLSPTLFQRNMKSLKISLMDTPHKSGICRASDAVTSRGFTLSSHRK